MRTLPPSRFPNIAALMEPMLGDDEDADERFEFGLDLIVRGLASFAPR
jgi:hypothetical protein